MEVWLVAVLAQGIGQLHQALNLQVARLGEAGGLAPPRSPRSPSTPAASKAWATPKWPNLLAA